MNEEHVVSPLMVSQEAKEAFKQRDRLESCSTAAPSPRPSCGAEKIFEKTSTSDQSGTRGRRCGVQTMAWERLRKQAEDGMKVSGRATDCSFQTPPRARASERDSDASFQTPPRRRTFAIENQPDSEWNKSPPCSPVRKPRARTDGYFGHARASPPPAPHQRKKDKKPALLTALEQSGFRDVAMVRKALEEDPQAATLPFFDHEIEPPLCAAIRLKCSPEVISLLLEYGADVSMMDIQGRTPLDIISLRPPPYPGVGGGANGNGALDQVDPLDDLIWGSASPVGFMMLGGTEAWNRLAENEENCRRNTVECVELLLNAGADLKTTFAKEIMAGVRPTGAHYQGRCDPNTPSYSCRDLAEKVGNKQLVALFDRHRSGVQ